MRQCQHCCTLPKRTLDSLHGLMCPHIHRKRVVKGNAKWSGIKVGCGAQVRTRALLPQHVVELFLVSRIQQVWVQIDPKVMPRLEEADKMHAAAQRTATYVEQLMGVVEALRLQEGELE